VLEKMWPDTRHLRPFPHTMRSILILTLLVSHCLVQAGTFTGRVVHVTDGDTLVVVDANYTRHSIRMLGIAAPVYGQPFAAQSKERLAVAVAGKFVVVEYKGRDREERILGKVLLGHQDMNLEQVRAGLAWHEFRHQYQQSRIDREKYAQAEREARRYKRGFWAAAARGRREAAAKGPEDSQTLPYKPGTKQRR